MAKARGRRLTPRHAERRKPGNQSHCIDAMPEPSTVCYAISSGSYSDYKINAVFSSKEKAEAKLNFFADGKIEEFPFDPEMAEAPAGMLPFACYSHKWDSATCEYVPCLRAFSVDYDSVVRAGNKVSAWVGTASITYVWAKDRDHAIKIAAERFAHHDAIKAGIAC